MVRTEAYHSAQLPPLPEGIVGKDAGALLPDAAIDLVYLDPPFNSNRGYNPGYLLETGGRDIPATPGNRGAYFVRTEQGALTVFGVFSIRKSEDAIRAFAGPDPQRVRYYPRDAEFLLEMPMQADHYSILDVETDGGSRPTAS